MGLFGSLIKSAVKTVGVPFAVVADVVTLGNVINSDETFTEKQVRSLNKEIKKVSKNLDNL